MTIHTLFENLEDIVMVAAESVRPPERLTVSEAAAKYRYLKNAESYEGMWLNETTPYLVEPMDCLTDTHYSSVCFVGPSQCGKTDMFLNYLAYTIKCDPADLMIVQTSKGTARDFSITRVDRLHDQNPDIGGMMLKRRDADNVFDKQYQNGMILRLTWPSNNELSGKPVPRIWISDADRMVQDVDGEGTVFYLSSARTTSFRKFGKVIIESSPGFLISTPQWVAKTPHEAPPCEGILHIYNQGDRRRWYWRCVNHNCQQSFEPQRQNLKWPVCDDPVESGEMAYIECPHCGHQYRENGDNGNPGKHEMNQLASGGGHAMWVKDGQRWTRDGLVGMPVRSKTASFWLHGAAAAFSTWSDLVASRIATEREAEETGVENNLKTVVNTKWGEPYMLRAQALARMPEHLRSRARDYGMQIVPHGVRFLVATVDIQGNRFVVQVHGIGTDDIWIVDRFEIKYSKRPQEDNPGQLKFVNAATHAEDWRLLVTEVMMKSYPLADDPDRNMAIFHTFADSGGSEGVSTNAYDFVRWLRWGYEGSDEDMDQQMKYPWFQHLFARFQLLKGEPNMNAPRIRLGFPDSQRKDRYAGARGEIPVLMMNVNLLKDALNNILDRTDKGGRINFPNWLGPNFYKELTVEMKDPKTGRWINPNKYRNESWDLLVYCLAGLLHAPVGWEHIQWDQPPTWAAEWDHNDMVFKIGGETPFEDDEEETTDLSALGELLG